MKYITAIAISLILLPSGVFARDNIRAVGSSTVYPFATVVAETFAKTTRFSAPVIESTGTGGGFKLFCQGIGVNTPDISQASRQIKKSEIEKCKEKGATPIEFFIGYDGIVLANHISAPSFSLTKKQIFLALAKKVPVNGKLVNNPYKNWNDIDSSLPKEPIAVYGPPPTSGTRDAFVELVMDEGAEQFPEIKSLDKNTFKAVARGLREDGKFIEVGENDNLIVQKLEANRYSLGIFGFSYLDQNKDKIKGSLIENIEPTFENISSTKYPVSRKLYIYVKKEHLGLIPGLKEYIGLFISEKMTGADGKLSDRGLIPLTKSEIVRQQAVYFTKIK